MVKKYLGPVLSGAPLPHLGLGVAAASLDDLEGGVRSVENASITETPGYFASFLDTYIISIDT